MFFELSVYNSKYNNLGNNANYKSAPQ